MHKFQREISHQSFPPHLIISSDERRINIQEVDLNRSSWTRLTILTILNIPPHNHTTTMGLFDDHLSFTSPSGPSALPPPGLHLLISDGVSASANVVLYHLFMSAVSGGVPVSPPNYPLLPSLTSTAHLAPSSLLIMLSCYIILSCSAICAPLISPTLPHFPALAPRSSELYAVLAS